MSLLHIVFGGPPEQKQSIKVTAMQSIAAALPEVCAKLKPAVDPASVKLSLNKKQVDINCPFRLANIPAGSILHITAYKPVAATAAPVRAQPTPTPTPTPAAPPAALLQPPTTGAPAPAVVQVHSSNAVPAPTPEPPAQASVLLSDPINRSHLPASSNVQAPAAPPAPAEHAPGLAPHPPSQLQDTAVHTPAAPESGPAAAAAAAATVPATTPAASGDDRAAAQSQQHNRSTGHKLGVTSAHAAPAQVHDVNLLQVCDAIGCSPARDALLTTEAALQAHAAAEEAAMSGTAAMGMDVDEDNDAFYELTPEDLMEASRAAEARRKEEAAFKTQAMREAEERAKMEAYGPVAVRLRFPDGLVMQAAFRASEQLQAVKDFLAALLVNPTSQLTLFITPPKQILKDMSITLYKAGLIPAAVVHCQVQGAAGSSLQLLRPELHSLLRTDLPVGYPLPGRQQTHLGSEPGSQRTRAAQDAAGVGSSSAAASRAVELARQALGGSGMGTGTASDRAGGAQNKGLPKWFKR